MVLYGVSGWMFEGKAFRTESEFVAAGNVVFAGNRLPHCGRDVFFAGIGR